MITVQSPLTEGVVSQFYSRQLGDGAAGMRWDIPPGSLLPPGMHLDPNTGFLFGIPTIPGTYSFFVRETEIANGLSTQVDLLFMIVNQQGTSSVTIEQLISEAFQLERRFPGQNVWFEQGVDDLGRNYQAIKSEVNGQTRTIASILIP